jgi:hypothetical protein
MDRERELHILEQLRQLNPGPLEHSQVERIYRVIMRNRESCRGDEQCRKRATEREVRRKLVSKKSADIVDVTTDSAQRAGTEFFR